MNTNTSKVSMLLKISIIAFSLFIIMFGVYVFLGFSEETLDNQVPKTGEYALKALFYSLIISGIILLQQRFISKGQDSEANYKVIYKTAFIVLVVMTLSSLAWLTWYFFVL